MAADPYARRKIKPRVGGELGDDVHDYNFPINPEIFAADPVSSGGSGSSSSDGSSRNMGTPVQGSSSTASSSTDSSSWSQMLREYCDVEDFAQGQLCEDHEHVYIAADAAAHQAERRRFTDYDPAVDDRRFKCRRRNHIDHTSAHCVVCRGANAMKLEHNWKLSRFLLVCGLCHQQATQQYPHGYAPRLLGRGKQFFYSILNSKSYCRRGIFGYSSQSQLS